jgi:hypothetical protein
MREEAKPMRDKILDLPPLSRVAPRRRLELPSETDGQPSAVGALLIGQPSLAYSFALKALSTGESNVRK